MAQAGRLCYILGMLRELVLLSVLPTWCWGQIGAAFEGKMVTVRIDMPATHEGVDLYPDRDQPLDLGSYQRRLKQFGIAVRSGQSMLVTKVKVKEKAIEFHLGGGGYGTFWDESGTVTASTIPKSSREKRLEDELRRENDPNRRRSIESDLRYEQRDRERRNDRARAEAAVASEIKKERIAAKRLDAGSRFNLKFESAVGAEGASAEMIRKVLADYVSFEAR